MKKTFTFIIALSFILLSVGGIRVAAQGGELELEYKTTASEAKAGDEVSVQIVLKNPSRQKIISVRNWMEYNPAHLEGVVIDSTASPFNLAAPGEDGFDAAAGQVKIGRANISGGVSDPEVVLATVKFKVKTASPVSTSLRPYDYQVTELGHVNVNIIEQGFPVNVLSKTPETLTLALNGGGVGGPSGSETLAAPFPLVPSPAATLNRPFNLKANTNYGTVDLKWEAPFDSARTGFYVYYGKTSGQYSRRRDVGTAFQVRIDNLNNEETYFFAVTAYDAQNHESDYSDEVGIIVNQPLSSTSPFEGLLQATLNRLPAQPANGPLAWWILFSAIGFAGTLLFRKSSSLS